MLKKFNILIDDVNRFLTPRRVLLLTFAFALIWIVLYQLFCIEIYRDMVRCYAWYSREFGRGIWNGERIAALPPLNIFLGGLFVKCGFESYHVHRFLGCFFFALTIYPLFHLLKNFLSEKASAWGCFFFITAPKLIRFSGMGLLESTRDFFLVSAVALLFHLWNRKGSVVKCVLFGFSLGFLALARGEGCIMAAGLFLGLLIRPLQDYRSAGAVFRKIIFPCVIAAISALIIVSPRLVEMWKLTGYPVIDTRSISVFKAIPFADRVFHDRSPVPIRKTDPAWTAARKADGKTEYGAAPQDSFFRYLPVLIGQMARGGYEVYLGFAAFGLILLIRKHAWRKEYSFLLLFSLAVSWILGHYATAYRYFVFLIPLLMVFTINGVLLWLEFAGKLRLRSAVLCGLTFLALFQTKNAWGGLCDQKNAHRTLKMVRYLKENREFFLPASGHSRKLILFAVDLPEIEYYADEERYLEYGDEIAPAQASGFDVLLCERREKNQCKVLLAQKNLVEIPHPMQQYYLLMTLKKDNSREKIK